MDCCKNDEEEKCKTGGLTKQRRKVETKEQDKTL